MRDFVWGVDAIIGDMCSGIFHGLGKLGLRDVIYGIVEDQSLGRVCAILDAVSANETVICETGANLGEQSLGEWMRTRAKFVNIAD